MPDSNHNDMHLPIVELAAALRARRQYNQLDKTTVAAQWGISESLLDQLESEQFAQHLNNYLQHLFQQNNIFISSQPRQSISNIDKNEIENIVIHSPLVVIRWRTMDGWPIEFVSENIINLLGYTPAELCNGKILYQDLIHPEDLPHVIAMDKSYLDEGIRDGCIEYRLIHRNGKSVHVIEYSSGVINEQGEMIYANGIIQDITELKEAQEKADLLTFYDPLTGLENRELFKKRLEHVIKVITRNKTSAALFFLDIDRFKVINDSLGHDLGDALLKIIAERLRKCLREEDTIARLGGDEFAIILPNVEAISGADIVAQNILNTLNSTVQLGTQEINITASIGITMTPEDSSNVNVLLKNAELAMYQSKSQGRNTYRFYINDMNAAAEERLFIQNGLRHAIDYDELTVYFQPQVNLQTHKMTSMEALIRWQHPDRGMIPPLEFISVAEESGLIIDIGNWVLRESCKKAQEFFLNSGSPIKVCVNLSTSQFQDKTLVDSVKRALADTGLSANYLELEITESMLMHDLSDALVTLNALKNLGISLSIDDFGTGYSSLSYLKRLPINIVKVDQSFVREIPHDLNDMEITAAVISMAHNLQLKVVAEGVETEDQQDFLTISKCDYAQGYFYSKPVPGDVIESVIRAFNNDRKRSITT